MARRARIDFGAITADGQYPTAAGLAYQGGNSMLLVDGTVGGGTYALQILTPSGAWITVASPFSLTAVGTVTGYLPAGQFRVNTSGSTTPAVNVSLVGIPANEGG